MPAASVEARSRKTDGEREIIHAAIPVAIRFFLPCDSGLQSASLISCRLQARAGHAKAYREILGVATEDRADLIVMGVHGRNALDLMLFGSTTNHVVRQATCPVLTLRR